MDDPWGYGRTRVIAEVGVNHAGSVEQALELTRRASDVGADAVKFQLFSSDELAGPDAPVAEYQRNLRATRETQRAMLKSLELDVDDMSLLKEEADRLGIEFMCTAFDPQSLRNLVALGIERVKVPSGEITNLRLLEEVGDLGLPTLLSTGMATLDEVQAAVNALEFAGLDRRTITLLHCTSLYPTAPEDANLKAITTMATLFDMRIGFSDHTLGVSAAMAAVALGACVVEKHITLDRSAPGPDHRASMEPTEFAQMIAAIREVEDCLGTGLKEPAPAELAMRTVARRSLVASQVIRVGDTFSPENVTAKRPGSGLSPMVAPGLYGIASRRDYQVGERIEF